MEGPTQVGPLETDKGPVADIAILKIQFLQSPVVKCGNPNSSTNNSQQTEGSGWLELSVTLSYSANAKATTSNKIWNYCFSLHSPKKLSTLESHSIGTVGIQKFHQYQHIFVRDSKPPETVLKMCVMFCYEGFQVLTAYNTNSISMLGIIRAHGQLCNPEAEVHEKQLSAKISNYIQTKIKQHHNNCVSQFRHDMTINWPGAMWDSVAKANKNHTKNRCPK